MGNRRIVCSYVVANNPLKGKAAPGRPFYIMAYELNFKILMLIKFLQNLKFKKYILDPEYVFTINRDEDSLLDGKTYTWWKNFDFYSTKPYIPGTPLTPNFRDRLKINI